MPRIIVAADVAIAKARRPRPKARVESVDEISGDVRRVAIEPLRLTAMVSLYPDGQREEPSGISSSFLKIRGVAGSRSKAYRPGSAFPQGSSAPGRPIWRPGPVSNAFSSLIAGTIGALWRKSRDRCRPSAQARDRQNQADRKCGLGAADHRGKAA